MEHIQVVVILFAQTRRFKQLYPSKKSAICASHFFNRVALTKQSRQQSPNHQTRNHFLNQRFSIQRFFLAFFVASIPLALLFPPPNWSPAFEIMVTCVSATALSSFFLVLAFQKKDAQTYCRLACLVTIGFVVGLGVCSTVTIGFPRIPSLTTWFGIPIACSALAGLYGMVRNRRTRLNSRKLDVSADHNAGDGVSYIGKD